MPLVRRGQRANRSTGSLAGRKDVERRLPLLLHPFGFEVERPGFFRAGPIDAGRPPPSCVCPFAGNASPLWSACVIASRASTTASANRPNVTSISLRLLALFRRFGPVLMLNAHLEAGPHRLQRLGQAAERTEANRGLVQQPGLIGFTEIRGNATPRLVEERRHGREIGSDRSELFPAIKATPSPAAQNAVEVDLVARLLLSTREATVNDSLIERLQAIERIGAIRRLAQMFVQPQVGS